MPKKKILLTGAAGRIGKRMLAAFRDTYDMSTLDQKALPESPRHFTGDLNDTELLKQALQGQDTLIHLAGNPWPGAEFKDLLPPNVEGVYALFEAARLAGVKRIIFASSVHTVWACSRDEVVDPNAPPRPANLYGASKVMGEILGRYFFEAHGVEFVGVRIGWYGPTPEHGLESLIHVPELTQYLFSPEDCNRLFRCAIDVEKAGHVIVFGTSIPEREFLSLETAKNVLGYVPQDRAVDFLEQARKLPAAHK